MTAPDRFPAADAPAADVPTADDAAPAALRLSLVAHTNVGKTTLARTLLGRDIGEVRDAPHVTEFAEDHVLLRTPQGDELHLWDTPGFGDSVRLVRRLRLQHTPLGWFLTQVWDRWRDRPFWASQQAVRHVRDESDVVLYLANAGEPPTQAGYVAAEMELLDWVGKPVLVLLNQLGAPRPAADEAAEIAQWRAHLASWTRVRGVLPLDAFARCWVQEGALLAALAPLLADAAPRRAALARLHAQWAQQRLATFSQAMQVLAESLGRVAAAQVPLGEPAAPSRLAGLLQRLRPGAGTEAAAAEARLAEQLDEEVRTSTDRLLALHGIAGSAQPEILERVARQVDVRAPVPEGRASLVGGVVSGALSGLAADLMSGGLTLGAGMLAGGLLGAMGGAGVARALNVARGTGEGYATWSDAALTPLVHAALLRYLAVAHFGRGRGQWTRGEAPAHWRDVVDAALVPETHALAAIWSSRVPGQDAGDEAARLAARLAPVLERAAREVLEHLYPGTWPGH